MTKELFIKKMSHIQNFQSQKQTLKAFISKLTNSNCYIEMGDYLIDDIINTITEELNISDKDLLFWWLYETVDKVIYITEGEDKKEISIRTLEELYGYIIENYNK